MRDVGGLHKASNTLRIAPLALLLIKSAIQDRNAAVGVHVIGCADFAQAMLKTVVQPGNFIPGAEITVLIKVGNRVNPLRHPGTRQQP